MSGRRWRVALTLSAALSACGGKAEAVRPPVTPRPVRLHTVATVAMPSTLAVTGVLAAQEELPLGMQVGGRLADLRVDVGDQVAAGAPLALLDGRDFDLDIARAQAALQAACASLGVGAVAEAERIDPEQVAAVREARAVLGEATLARERTATMVQEQLRAPADLEAADATLAVAQSRVQRARDDVRQALASVAQRRVDLMVAEKRLADSQLRAPWPGRVAARSATVGQVVAPGERLLTLVRTDPLRLRLQVPERLVAQVALGQTVQFSVDGRSETKSGKVVRLGAGVERSTRTLLVEAEVANPDGVLLPGAFCRAQIVVAEAATVVVVPSAAVVSFAGVDRVFTVEAVPPKASGGAPGAPAGAGVAAEPAAAPAAVPALRAKGRIVQLGRDLGDRIEVVQGLAVGTEIVADAKGILPDAPVVVER
jgi:RND family efflux transporter MFP subunit